MRRLTLAFLTVAYIAIAAMAMIYVMSHNGGWGGGVAMMSSILALCFGFHGLIENAARHARMQKEVDRIRQAHALLLEQVETLDGRLGEVAESMSGEAVRRTEALEEEVHDLEDAVHRMNQRLEGSLSMQVAARQNDRSRSNASRALLEQVREALSANRVDLYLQPVVSLPQRRTVFYESFSRLRDDSGRVMMPAEYLAVAEPEGLVAAIDNLLLFRCVQIVRRLARQDRKVGIFCNISLASLGDEAFFTQFLEFLSNHRDLSGALIFELGQAAFAARGATEARHMARLADLGFRFSLDKVTDLDLDFQDLARSDVKFVKISAAMLIEQLEEQGGRLVLRSLPDLQANDFARLTRRYGVETIVEKVENERQVVDVLDLDIAYGQGHLFGEPRAIKDSVLAEADPPADFMRGALRRASGW